MDKSSYKEIHLESREIERYSRHLSLPEIGIVGQKKLKSSSVVCIGSGGLGSPLLMYLAAAGVGTIGIVDFDFVEESNLQRQVIHSTSWLNKPKVVSAKERLKAINPLCNIKIFETKLTKNNSFKIIKDFDIVCDCTDNFSSRYLINDTCVILKKPNVYGSIDRFFGQATVFNLNENSPNFRDLIPIPPPQELIPSCSEAGVLGVLPGLIGVIQATEVIKIISGVGETLDGRLLVFDALKMRFKELTLIASKKIKAKIYKSHKDEAMNQTNQVGDNNFDPIQTISVIDLKRVMDNNLEDFILLDVRNDYEYEYSSIEGSKLIPLSHIENGSSIKEIKEMCEKKSLFVICKSGIRSAKALIYLQEYGLQGKNVIGGMDAWEMLSK